LTLGRAAKSAAVAPFLNLKAWPFSPQIT